MAKIFDSDVTKDMKHIVVEGLDQRSGETLGTLMPTGCSAAAGQQGQGAQK